MKDAATSSFDSIFSLIRLHKRCTFQRLHKSLHYQVVQWKAQVRQTDSFGCDSTSVSKFWNSVLQSAIDCVKEITTIRNHLFRMQFFRPCKNVRLFHLFILPNALRSFLGNVGKRHPGVEKRIPRLLNYCDTDSHIPLLSLQFVYGLQMMQFHTGTD